MHRQITFKTSILPVIATALLVIGNQCRANGFVYNDFSAPSSLIFQGEAKLVEQRVRLTPAQRGQAGGLWFSTRQGIENGFETDFRFQFTERGGHGADGLAFVIQNNETPLLGRTGHAMGFQGIPNSLVVKFDPYHYKNKEYVKYDEVAVLKNNSLKVSPANEGVIGSATNAVFTDGQIHTVKIIYTPGNLKVFLDDLSNPLLTVPVDLSEAIASDGGRAWVGFTAATGADFYNHDLIGWSFNSSAEPIQNQARTKSAITSQALIVNAPVASAPTYSGNSAQTSSTLPLPVDPAFGYALPDEIDLSHQIEASTDLVHWTPVTNAVLYFRDPDSTNYNQRYYRFQKK